jgi:hypothetical protein
MDTSWLGELEPYRGPILIGAGAVAGLLLLALVMRLLGRLFRRTAKEPDREAHLREDLTAYPPPPSPPGPRRLTIDGVPVRIRLIVLAGAGQRELNPDDAQKILEHIRRGLGEAALTDAPKVVIWPAQLSQTGFAPKFHRLVWAPIREGKPSPWVLPAGPAKLGRDTVLLGLALLADEPTTLGRIEVQPGQWYSLLRFEKFED